LRPIYATRPPKQPSLLLESNALKSTARFSCDIFCRVIDNFGDLGLTWRLARQLANEFNVATRLFVDDLASLAKLVPGLDLQMRLQKLNMVDVQQWPDEVAKLIPADCVIEAFQCALPNGYVNAMAALRHAPVWLNLDYLSAESWVAEHHLLPSPHPQLALTKYFFFPGFEAGTGGLLRERHLFLRRDAAMPRDDVNSAAEPRLFIFAYPNRALPALIAAIESSTTQAMITLPEGKLAEQYLQAHDVKTSNANINIQPFVPQTEFDALLWANDICIVRGEDSFVRAQWAAKPFVWHIYPQAEGVHWQKLIAFLDRYCIGLTSHAEASVREMWRAWNAEDAGAIASAWRDFLAHRGDLEIHARNWADQLATQVDLATNLVTFVEKSAKI
jgi:uncharacterized repeat protein (TIGR03837 family)